MRLDAIALSALLVAAFALSATGCASTSARNDGTQFSGPRAAGGGSSAPRRSRAENTQTRRANSDVLVELGQRYYERGEYQIALEKLQSALEIDSTSPNAHTVLAIVYETIDQLDRAGQHYRRSAQLAPNDGVVQNNYGSWLCRQQRYADADRAFRNALSDPFYRTPSAALTNAGTCALAAGRFEVAEDYLQRALRVQPEDEQALLGMADLAFRSGDFLRARAFLQRADAQGRLAGPALELAAQVEEYLGDTGSAAAYRSRLGREGGG